jgi:lipopolysaccharide/colanic/teichoic acid biosynthesis glycosyltransferase
MNGDGRNQKCSIAGGQRFAGRVKNSGSFTSSSMEAKPSYEAGDSNHSGGGAPLGVPLWKRVFDLLLLLVTLPAWLVLGAIVALIIRLGSRGPLFFHQERVGHHGRIFTCFKFRTMRINADPAAHHDHVKDLIRSSAPMVKLDAAEDDRLTRGGSWIRASGMDELPQIINIIRGEMSIVGPRPCIPYEYDLYEPWQRQRFNAPPGLTGLWQVSGKNRTTFEEMIHLDIDYARRMSVWLDLKILLLTAPAIVQQVLDMRAAKQLRRTSPQAAAEPPRVSRSTSVPTQEGI